MHLKVITEIRTNNFNDAHVMEKITDMWKGASSELSTHHGNTYGLYYDYESDYKGDYTLCVAIEDNRELSITLPGDAAYEIFTVDTDDGQGIFKTWKKIWEKEEAGTLKRAYTYDFEKYYPDDKIDIYIAVEK